ncbi:MAG TPA: universal stress protein [Planctomycetota bacterium]
MNRADESVDGDARAPALPRIRHVMVCLDGSPVGEGALPCAHSLARAFGARVSLVRVLESVSSWARRAPVDALDWEISRAEAEEYLGRLKERAGGKEQPIGSAVLQGHAAEQILRFARERGVDLIAVASHGEKGITGWTLSSTAEKIVARAGTSLLIVPSTWAAGQGGIGASFRRIFLPLDASPRAECVIPALTSLARSQAATLILAHVVPGPELTRSIPPSGQDLELVRQLTSRNERVARQYIGRMRAHLMSEALEVQGFVEPGGDVRQTLCDLADREHADLIVISAHGSASTQVNGYGSTARHLISHARVPLLVVRTVSASDAQNRAAPRAPAATAPIRGSFFHRVRP